VLPLPPRPQHHPRSDLSLRRHVASLPLQQHSASSALISDTCGFQRSTLLTRLYFLFSVPSSWTFLATLNPGSCPRFLPLEIGVGTVAFAVGVRGLRALAAVGVPVVRVAVLAILTVDGLLKEVGFFWLCSMTNSKSVINESVDRLEYVLKRCVYEDEKKRCCWLMIKFVMVN